ncbi:MAG: succinate dehydrogenase assembly factor 4 [Pseudomonadota bacterium]
MSAESWPCRKRAASDPRNASTPKAEGGSERFTAAGLLIFVFERVSYGREGAILAEFAPVPNAPSDVDVPVVAAAVPTGAQHSQARPADLVNELGGPQGPEPTRFGDWEKNGRCIDF